jgi:hypothetical protein
VNKSVYSGLMGTCGTGVFGVDAAILVLVIEYGCRVARTKDAEMVRETLRRWRENSVRVVLLLKTAL